MPLAPCLIFDNRMDRREFLNLLDRLPPRKRMAWLEWCCARSRVGNSGVRPGVREDMWGRMRHANVDDSASEKLSIEVMLDAFNLALQYQLDLGAALAELERVARNHRR